MWADENYSWNLDKLFQFHCYTSFCTIHVRLIRGTTLQMFGRKSFILVAVGKELVNRDWFCFIAIYVSIFILTSRTTPITINVIECRIHSGWWVFFAFSINWAVISNNADIFAAHKLFHENWRGAARARLCMQLKISISTSVLQMNVRQMSSSTL